MQRTADGRGTPDGDGEADLSTKASHLSLLVLREKHGRKVRRKKKRKKNGTTSTHNAKNVGRELFTTVLFPSFCVVQ